MRILIVNNGVIPVHFYGGIERVIWGLGRELVNLGHKVSYLVETGSYCDFAPVFPIDRNKTIIEQIGQDYDIIHFNFTPPDIEKLEIPYIITIHGNSNHVQELDNNTVFVSENHAQRFGSESFVHNGLDWNEYPIPEIQNNRTYFHFLGNAAWRVKNVAGAIKVIKKTRSEQLMVLGGVRFNINMGIRFTFSPRVRFAGMVGGKEKSNLLNGSKGLIFPVRWHEPFGLAIIESLYFGCPVFGTPYGSLPELIKGDTGFLSDNAEALADAILSVDRFSRQRCHEYAVEEFNSKKMALNYLTQYEKVISGQVLNLKPPKLTEIQTKKWLNWN